MNVCLQVWWVGATVYLIIKELLHHKWSLVSPVSFNILRSFFVTFSQHFSRIFDIEQTNKQYPILKTREKSYKFW